jgi:hypothetical protein
VLPSDEGFDSVYSAGGQVDYGLVVDQKLPLSDGLSKGAFSFESTHRSGPHRLGEYR